MSKPVVAIVGRPNVGKSTLFNKLIGERRSIVEDTPGVTRDRIYAEAEWNERRFILIDTGGIEPKSEDTILKQMRLQAEIAVASADVIIFLCDVRAGLLADDRDIAVMLKKSGKPIIVGVNKVDRVGEVPYEFYEFYELGFERDPISLSALHGTGSGDLLDAIIEECDFSDADDSDDGIINVAVIGKPNAGKSSLLNALLGENRAIVTDIPGTTRDAVEVPFTIGSGPEARRYMLVDTAGMKPHTKMSKTSVDNFSLFRSEQAIEEADVVLLVMDPIMGPTLQDKRIAGKILDANRSCVVLMNKWDLAQEQGITETKVTEALRSMMPFLNFAPVVYCSNKSGYNIRRTVEAIDRAAASACERIPTGMLNNVLVKATKKTLSPMMKGKRLKIYYALQVSTNPQTIRLFVNDPKLVTPAYLSYLEKNIRARFGLEGAPLRMFLKARERKSS